MLDYSYKGILKVALPIMLSGFIQSVISITDAAFLGHFSREAYDAASTGGLWHITLSMILIGWNDGAQIKMAQYIGEKRLDRFESSFIANILILSVSTIILLLFVQFISESFLLETTNNKALAQGEFRFIEIRSYSFIASIFSLSIQAKLLAEGKTKFVLFYSLIVALTNVILDYCLIFGKYGFPRWGMEGAAIASTVAEIIGMLFYLVVFLKKNSSLILIRFNDFKTTSFQVYENIKIGFPLLLQGFVALSVWTLFFILIEKMGSEKLTISLNIRHIYFIAFVPVWGFAGATKTFIAQYVGARELEVIPFIQKRIQLMCVLFLVICFHGAVLYPEYLISLVNSDELLISRTANILRIVSGAILIYGLGSVYFQSISGIGFTRYTFYIEVISTVVYIVSAYLFIVVLESELEVVWLVEYIYFITMGGLSLLFLKRYNWKKRYE
ncbi:MAG: MATE family efflux transporter [Fluviicola sp.]